MDPFLVALWVVRLALVALIWIFLFAVARVLLRDVRRAAAEPGAELGRLVVVASPDGQPLVGSTFAVDAVTTIGRDLTSTVVIDDAFASAEHAVVTYRGRAWFIEDRGSTNGTYVNGSLVEGVVPLAVGDEIQVGRVRLRLERGRR
jgi:pSer/pThr/pTyr-binding forkhead associated (FHA) protein